MKVPQFLEEYVSQIDSYEFFVDCYKGDADKEYMYSLLDMYFTDKVNAAIGEVKSFLEKQGISESLIYDIESGYLIQSAEAIQD